MDIGTTVNNEHHITIIVVSYVIIINVIVLPILGIKPTHSLFFMT